MGKDNIEDGVKIIFGSPRLAKMTLKNLAEFQKYHPIRRMI